MNDLPAVTTGSDARGRLFEVIAGAHSPDDVVAALVGAGATPDDAVWVDHPSDALDAAMAAAGFTAQRDLWRMDVALPLSAAVMADTVPLDGSGDLRLRSFVPGADEAAWVRVNNRAFAWHREQGGWTVDEVVERQAEPWFDPDGFLLLDIDGELAGFCWTKIHDEVQVDDDTASTAGEIYVIGVDPDHHGKRLGQALTVAGLASIHQRGHDHGLLYVDADNIAAVRLYEKLGFTPHTIRRLYA